MFHVAFKHSIEEHVFCHAISFIFCACLLSLCSVFFLSLHISHKPFLFCNRSVFFVCLISYNLRHFLVLSLFRSKISPVIHYRYVLSFFILSVNFFCYLSLVLLLTCSKVTYWFVSVTANICKWNRCVIFYTAV